MLIEMFIKGLILDPGTNMPIVILRDEQGQRTLPIWVGPVEANAIALQIENVAPPRPMTHDLLRNLLAGLGGAKGARPRPPSTLLGCYHAANARRYLADDGAGLQGHPSGLRG